MKQDNRGLTLIELIIAITVSAIIMLTITLFISNALRSYNAATGTVDLQMEAQVMMEQLSSWIMEGNYVTVKPITITDAHDNTVQVDVLLIYHLPRLVPEDRLPLDVTQDTYSNRRMIWMQDGKLYMYLYPDDAEDAEDVEESEDEEDEIVVLDPTADVITADDLIATEDYCICEFMESFIPTWNEEKGTVSIEVKLKTGSQEYQLENEFKVRNEIL